MKKNQERGISNIRNTNICILCTILCVFIFSILYKYFTLKNEIQESIQTSESIKGLYSSNEFNEVEAQEEIKLEKDINSNITDWELILVNKKNNIPENYIVELQELEDGNIVDKRIAEYLNQMLNAAREEGLYPIICSSYRTNEKQKKLYDNKVAEYRRWGCELEEAEEYASYWVAIPGTGEHETGLAVDIVSSEYQILNEQQEDTKVQKWLIANSYKYGFTLRYPTDKKDITMINYEPWHYRYVGTENATYMKEHNMCLEEYIKYLEQFEDDEQ